MPGVAQIIDFLLAGLEDINGNPLSGGSVHCYDAGLLSDKDIWVDRDMSVLSTNPIILDVYGRAVVYGSGWYKFLIRDSSGNLIKTIDYYNAKLVTSTLTILVADPDTTGWGVPELGTIWVNSTDGKAKMWNGTDIVLLG